MCFLVLGFLLFVNELFLNDKCIIEFFVIRCWVFVFFMGEIVVVNVCVSMFVLLIVLDISFIVMMSIFGYGLKGKM